MGVGRGGLLVYLLVFLVRGELDAVQVEEDLVRVRVKARARARARARAGVRAEVRVRVRVRVSGER